ncbi:MAG: class I SAM-dependent methyltransferase, partial [Bradyrhizobium sp.]|nr:class I SAM-dependent methyltransferase [Bradyrhizobium sp.]
QIRAACETLATTNKVVIAGETRGPASVTNEHIEHVVREAIKDIGYEQAGFHWKTCDIEILRLHYADTLKAWRERFLARREEAVQLYDERFARMWEFYLAASEMAFRKQNMMNFQIQLTKRQGIVPMTRDYIQREEARLRTLERGTRPTLRMAGE